MSIIKLYSAKMIYHFHNNRFGRQYLILQEGSEDLRAASSKDFKPNLRKHNKKEFHLEYVFYSINEYSVS